MADAAFHFDAQASLLKKSIAAGGTTTAALDDTTGVSSVLWTVVAAYNSSTSDWSLSSTTGTSTVVTAPAGSAKSCILQCKVNGGVQIDPVTGRQTAGGQTIRTAKIYIVPETIVTGETTESDATNGWSPIVNAAIVATGGTSALAGTALNLSDGADSLSLTRSGSNLWLMTAGTGDSIKIDSAANITLDVGGSTGTIDLTHADVSTCALVLDSDGPLTCTVGQAVTSVTFGQTQKTSGAGAAWTMRAQQGQAGQVGGALTIGGGDGGTPGTNLAGATVVQLGSAVSNATAKLQARANTTNLLTVKQNAASQTLLEFGDTDTSLIGGQVKATYINVEPTVHFAITAPDIYLTANTAIHKRVTASTGEDRLVDSTGTNVYERRRIFAFGPISSATTTTVGSFATTSNRAYKIKAEVTLSNDTDNEAKSFESIATMKNVAGTLSASGAVTAVHAVGDAGQGGITFTIDSDGSSTARARLTTDSADTVNGRCILTITETVLA